MKKVAEECHFMLQNAQQKQNNQMSKGYSKLNANDFLRLSGAFNDILRIDYSIQESRLSLDPYSHNWTRKEFDDLFLSPSHIPCMFTNRWNRNWNVFDYYQSLRCSPQSSANITVKIGQGDNAIDMKWNHFMEYLQSDCLEHDEPLYVIDDDFHLKLPDFTQTYSVPSPFAWTLHNDVFSYYSDADRPSYRWLVIGGWRSGSPIHTDPYCSSAWNVGICGRKRWFVFPECYLDASSDLNELHRLLRGDTNEWDGLYSPQPILNWVCNEYHKLMQYKMKEKNTKLFQHFYEFIQEPGDMVYIPKGWAHAVLNLDETVAVTHNFTLKEDAEMVFKCWKQQAKTD